MITSGIQRGGVCNLAKQTNKSFIFELTSDTLYELIGNTDNFQGKLKIAAKLNQKQTRNRPQPGSQTSGWQQLWYLFMLSSTLQLARRQVVENKAQGNSMQSQHFYQVWGVLRHHSFSWTRTGLVLFVKRCCWDSSSKKHKLHEQLSMQGFYTWEKWPIVICASLSSVWGGTLTECNIYQANEWAFSIDITLVFKEKNTVRDLTSKMKSSDE